MRISKTVDDGPPGTILAIRQVDGVTGLLEVGDLAGTQFELAPGPGVNEFTIIKFNLIPGTG